MPIPLAIAGLVKSAPVWAPLLGKVLGGAAKGSADQRRAENTQSLLQSQLQSSDMLGRAGLMNSNANVRSQEQNRDNQFRSALDLDRKQFSQSEPMNQARQALTGSMMQRIQPLQMNGLSDRFQRSMPKMNSIIDAIGPEARQAGGLLAQRGLQGLQNGPSQFTDLPPVSLPDVLSLPPAQLAVLQKSGLLEKIMGSLGIAGSAIGAFAGQPGQTSGNGLPVDPYGGG